MVYYISKNMWDWKFEGFVKLLFDKMIDVIFFWMFDGKWCVWYKDEICNVVIMMVESDDLFYWMLNDILVID